MKNSPLNVVVLAAGKGARMHSALPKVLHPLAGRPLLAHVLDKAAGLKADRSIVVYGHGGEAVPSAFVDSGAAFVRQEPQLGTGHAVQQALPHLLPGGQTLILYGDVPLTRGETLRTLVDAANDRLALLTALLDDPTGYGRIVRDKRGAIRRIVEEKDADARQKMIREVNVGILCAPTDGWAKWLPKLGNDNAQKEFYLTDVIALAIASGMRVESRQAAETWEILGVNSKDQLARLERVYQLEQAMRLMKAGVTIADPWRFDLRGDLACGHDVSIDVNCVFEGSVKLGHGVRIGAGCVLKNVEAGDGTEFLPYCHVDGASFGSNCRIGPFARMRPGTSLSDEVHVGNFVELKATVMGKASKANHLAYLGDTTTGSKVNIGAGTIACNYDGANKHRTVIEDDAFIGSDTQLVAPVTVGRGATLGAGTTLTSDAPPGELTISRARQTTIAGWKRPAKKSTG